MVTLMMVTLMMMTMMMIMMIMTMMKNKLINFCVQYIFAVICKD